MRIALCYPGCHRRGGIERVVLECANFLSDRGHEIHLYVSHYAPELLRPGITPHHIPEPFRFPALAALYFAFQSRRSLRRLDPAPAVIATFGVQCPPGDLLWVPSVHRSWLDVSRRNRGFAGSLKQWCNPFHTAILALERLYFGGRRYRKLLVHTEDVRSDLMSLYHVPEDDIAILPNGYSESEFNIAARREHRAAVRAELGYGDSDRVVIFVANELERKGFGPLLRAIASLNDPRIRILAVGRLDPESYRAEIDRLGMTQRVSFTGPSDKVARFYAAADVFGLPTQYEAWGLVIIEAMACGLPVLTSRLAGAAVAVRDGETGRLLGDPRDPREIAAAIAPLLDGKHGSPEEICASVSDYKWSRIFIRYEEALAECARARANETQLREMEIPVRDNSSRFS